MNTMIAGNSKAAGTERGSKVCSIVGNMFDLNLSGTCEYLRDEGQLSEGAELMEGEIMSALKYHGEDERL
jgi:hypothetical protein